MEDSPQVTHPSDHAQATGADATSQQYVGRWNRLVSTTNWEKGLIISQWREALVEEGVPSTEYSDDAWSRRVGGVSAQHVGRLRRVHQRFSQTKGQYEGLYWSHFQAALDWDDAEMWLEGALQNEWSVSRMRRTRWETLGAVAEQEPRDDEIVVADWDEDGEPSPDDSLEEPAISGEYAEVQGPQASDEAVSTRGSDAEPTETPVADDGALIYADEDARETIEFVRPFENLAELPNDLSEAFEAFKLAILRHKTDGWQQVSCEDVMASLDALKELALAPAADGAPF